MFEIKGKMNTALCRAVTIEDSAREQIERMCSYPLAEGSVIRIMPDVHAGKGCTVGTTMTVNGRACPNIVGVDIGCGMYTVRLNEKDIDFEKVDRAAHHIPSGMNVWDRRVERFDLTALRCYRQLKDSGRLERSLGTLGGGNHFIEIDKASDGTMYLVIHSGSRNLGKQVAEIYQQLAIDLHTFGEEYYDRRDEIISTYKAEGRRKDIQAALRELEKERKAKRKEVPDDLCWLEGEYLEDYLHDIEICQDFAVKNREVMAGILMERSGLSAADSFHTIHNYISVSEMILRKGAISAREGERVLIPMNMKDGSLLCAGKGNPDWNFSAPHGAGRIMSRAEAKRKLSVEEYRQSMDGIYTTTANGGTLDEAPMAYKPMEEIVSAIGDTVDIIDVIKPVYNFKAAEERLWKKNRK